jgi:lipopolysaccharide/colanic/teichoic acid biosynthesis glycosyltransferase
MTARQELTLELKRFMLLWSYQHPIPPFTLWWRLVLKRAVDFVGAAAGLVLLAPVMGLIALIIKLDSKGPVLYSQERLGRFGESFKIYKFRSMIVDAEAAGPVWASLGSDARITRVGRFLRNSHLDELPQLFNVLRGEMSLVGPRPERPCFAEGLNRDIPRYEQRLMIKPGMTGLAQVHYRYDASVEDVKRKLRFDLLYVRRMCLMLDARIIAWTFVVCLTGRGVR